MGVAGEACSDKGMQLGVVGSLASVLPSLSGCAPGEVEWSPLEVGGKEGGEGEAVLWVPQ